MVAYSRVWLVVLLGIPISIVINNSSSSPNERWVNSPWGRRPNGLLTQRPQGGERNNCFSKIQLVGQKYRDYKKFFAS